MATSKKTVRRTTVLRYGLYGLLMPKITDIISNAAIERPSQIYPNLKMIPESLSESGVARPGIYRFAPADGVAAGDEFYRKNHLVDRVQYWVGSNELPDGSLQRDIRINGHTTEGQWVQLNPNNVERVGDYPEDTSRKIPYDDATINLLSRLLFIEAGGDREALYKGEFFAGLTGVANTLITRYFSPLWNPGNDSIEQVATRPNQYAFSRSVPEGYFTELMREIIVLGLEDRLADIVQGADSFYAPRWAWVYLAGKNTRRIGGHQFLIQGA